MADETTKSILEVKKGDFVMGSDSVNEVENVMIIPQEGWLYSLNGGDYFVSETHPFMTKDGTWKAFNPEGAREINPELAIEQLAVGDILVTHDGFVELTQTDRIWRQETVYNINVSNSHDYYADGYLVHNKLACMPDPPYCPVGYVCESGICIRELPVID